jgi:N-acetylglutamate synthase-like GNAT family acetyltransferase
VASNDKPAAGKATQAQQDISMQLLDLRQRSDAIDLIAPWHFAEWGALFPTRTLADFVAELALCMTEDALPKTWLLLDAAGDIIGTGSLLLQDMTTNHELSPWLANIYLLPEARGQGLGKWLVQELMQQAAQLQIPNLYLFTEDQLPFYQRLGWQLHHTEFYEGHWVSVMHWQPELIEYT